MAINFVSSQSVQWVAFFEFKFIGYRKIITSDDVCCNIRNVKFIKVIIMQFKQMFVTAVCVLFLLKLKWPKSKKKITMTMNSFPLSCQYLRLFLSKAGSPAELNFAQLKLIKKMPWLQFYYAAQSASLMSAIFQEKNVRVVHLATSSTSLVHPFVLKYIHSLNVFFQMHLQKLKVKTESIYVTL